jgi:hypothetical protein
LIFEDAGLGKNLIIFAAASPTLASLFCAKDVKQTPIRKLNMVNSFFSNVKVMISLTKAISRPIRLATCGLLLSKKWND